jgi:preprotein translocase subunit SecA
MAGRGTDIKISDEIKELGGLAVIGSERHEARRIDNQLRGRSGRQGDPGYSRFYVSFDDDLLKRFGEQRIFAYIKKSIGDDHLESKMFSRYITKAQTSVEGFNFDIRKSLIGFDDVLGKQRQIMYQERDAVLLSQNAHEVALKMFKTFAPNFVLARVDVRDRAQFPNIEKINSDLNKMFGVTTPLESKKYENALPEEVAAVIEKLLVAYFEARRQEWGDEIFAKVEKDILIHIIDRNWTNHIDKMAKLRNTVNLVTYAQQNPLQVYIKDGFRAFNEMTANIALEFVSMILRVKISLKKADEE